MADLVLDAGGRAVSDDSLAGPVFGDVSDGFLPCLCGLGHSGVLVGEDAVNLHRGVKVAGQLGRLPVLMGGCLVRVRTWHDDWDVGMAKEVTDVVDSADESLRRYHTAESFRIQDGEVMNLHRMIQVFPHELKGEHAVSPHLEDRVLGHQAPGPG